MKDKRLERIISLIPFGASLIDVGCDHGYVGLYMASKGSKVLFTDIHPKALNKARENALNSGIDALYLCTDGLNGIDLDNYQVIVIAGMGFHTIKHILNPYLNLLRDKTLILESNNDLDKLREYLIKNNFKIHEYLVNERKKYYVIFKVIDGKDEYTKEEYFLGKFNKDNLDYYKYLLGEYTKIYESIPDDNKKKNEVLEKINIINNFIERTLEN